MAEIEFTVMECSHGDADQLRPLLDAFEKQYHIHVKLTGITWDQGWSEISKFGIFGRGPDVSCVGTTWIGSLASMQALRPFTEQQVRALGGTDAFFESIWKTGFLPNDLALWAVPWLGNAVVFYYWKEHLEKAGIQDYEAAFATDSALVETLEKLQKSGIDYPLALNVTKKGVILQEATHWVWNAGGDFISPDFKRVAFNQPAALRGWKNYFSLLPFVSPEWLNAGNASVDSFTTEESAIHMGGPFTYLVDIFEHPELRRQHLGVALAPGTTIVGGTSFVVWQYSIHNEEAFELIRFLSSQPTRIPASPISYELPTRRDAINMPSAQSNIFHRAYLQAMQNGRSFPSIRLWGAIEDKLVSEIPNIWAELFANPDQDLDECLHRHFDPLAKRLDNTLGN
jgi:ABC-type glycerol-3-phosphate transport system substrate-binding protein